MRPYDPNWKQFYECRIVPSVRAEVMFELVKHEHVYITVLQGDGAKFAETFDCCWHGLPKYITNSIISHWNTARLTSIKSYPHTPYILLADKLVGKNASITYSFENVNIEMPHAQGPKGQEIGSGRLTINGKITISAELQKINRTT